MLTKRGYYNILDNIFQTGGLSEAMEEDLKKLKDDYEEREGMLKKYGEVYDGDDKEEYEYKEFETDSEDWKTKYETANNELAAFKERYRKRFFFGKDSADGIDENADTDLVDTPQDNKEGAVEYVDPFDKILYNRR